MPANAPTAMPKSHLDLVAQQAGFPDYATWQAWNQHRQDAITQGSNTTTSPTPGYLKPGDENFLQRIMGPIYPPTLLAMIGARYKDATGQ